MPLPGALWRRSSYPPRTRTHMDDWRCSCRSSQRASPTPALLPAPRSSSQRRAGSAWEVCEPQAAAIPAALSGDRDAHVH